MNVRLFNDNGCETLNNDGNVFADLVHDALKPLVSKAVKDGVSLRDLTTVVFEEISVLNAEWRIRKGIAEREAIRKSPEWIAKRNALSKK